MKPQARWFTIPLGALIVALVAYTALLGDLTRSIPRFLLLHGLMFAAYVTSIYLFSRLHEPYRRTLILIFVVAGVCRVVNLAAPPSLSTDIYRYLWEGRVIHAGHNPFSAPPAAPELEFLRDDNYEGINHKDYETIYPPLAQAVFYAGAVMKPNLTMQKVLFTVFDMAAMIVILLLLRQRGRNLNLCAVYGWSPLVLMEFSRAGHMDSLAIFLLMLTILLLQARRKVLGFSALALSFLAKYFSALLLPFFIFKRKYALWILVGLPIVILGYLPFVEESAKLTVSLREYGRHWYFNSLTFWALDRVVGNSDWIRLGLLGFLGGFALVQGRRQQDLMRYAFFIVGCSLLLSPTVHPWYVCWIVPFLCFYSSRAWLYFTGAVVFSYWVWTLSQATGDWDLGPGLLLAEYMPFYALLAYEAFRGRRLGRGVNR